MFKLTERITKSGLQSVVDRFNDSIALINRKIPEVEDHLIEEIYEVRADLHDHGEELGRFKTEYNELKSLWNMVATFIVVVLVLFIIATGFLIAHLQNEVNELRNELETNSQVSVSNQYIEEGDIE